MHPASFKQFRDYFESIFQSSELIDKIDLDKFGANEDKFSNTRGNGTEGLVLDPNICISDSLYAKKSKINRGAWKSEESSKGWTHTDSRK